MALAGLLLSACSVSNDLSSTEKSLLIVPKDLVAYGVKPDKLPNGKYQKTTSYLDRSVEYEYEIESSNPGF